MTGRLYVIPTYEQKSIWTDMQGMLTLIAKLELFSGDAYQSSPHLKTSKIELRKKNLFMDEREIICDTYISTEIDLD